MKVILIQKKKKNKKKRGVYMQNEAYFRMNSLYLLLNEAYYTIFLKV